jgi:hypothetical protein
MEERLRTEQQMIRYLLSELSIQDRLEIEMEYFTDPEVFDLLQEVEHDLIEGYVNGKLSPSGRVRFERNYLTTKGRREQVQFFQTLSSMLPIESKKVLKFQKPLTAVGLETIDLGEKRSFMEIILAPFRGPRLALGVSMAVAIMILAVVGAIRLFENGKQDNGLVAQNPPPQKVESPQQKAEQGNAKEQPTPAFRIIEEPPASVTSTAPKVPAVISFAWTVPGLRVLGENTPRIIRIPPGRELVQITLNFPDLAADRYSRFGITLQNSAGNEIWRRTDIRANRLREGSSMVLNIPAKQLKPGPYSLMLSGMNKREWVDIREFYIKVER